MTNDDPGDTGSIKEPKQDVRLADKIADRLSTVRGVPEFSPTWPKEQRDEAIAAIAAFVKQFGNRWSPRSAQSWEGPVSVDAQLRFPLLDHPASREDVAEGRAIFSNEGASFRQIWPTPETPIHMSPSPEARTQGRWITLKDYPQDNRLPDGSVDYDQKADVWQAEDALVNGRWQRTFGVVAKNKVTAVPAEEIEFGPPTGIPTMAGSYSWSHRKARPRRDICQRW